MWTGRTGFGVEEFARRSGDLAIAGAAVGVELDDDDRIARCAIGYNDQLNRAGVLRAVEIPPEGGRTGFVDGIALYDAISPEVRDRIEDTTVRYAMDVILDNLTYGRPTTSSRSSRARTP